MLTFFNKALLAILAILLVSLSLSIYNLNKEKSENRKLSQELTLVVSERDKLSKENSTLKILRDTTDSILVNREADRVYWDNEAERAKEALSIRAKEARERENKEKSLLSEDVIKDSSTTRIENAYNYKKAESNALNSSLDDDIIGLLNEVCERVRGSPCPNP